jgi:hypothetical protein
MLRPTKHTHPDRTLIFTAFVLLARLKKNRIEQYGKLKDFAKRTVEGGSFLFLPAINLLFLLGLVEYRPKNDSFEYVGDNENF